MSNTFFVLSPASVNSVGPSNMFLSPVKGPDRTRYLVTPVLARAFKFETTRDAMLFNQHHPRIQKSLTKLWIVPVERDSRGKWTPV